MARSDLQDGGVPPENGKIVSSVVLIMPVHHLIYMEMCNTILNILKIHPTGMATFHKKDLSSDCLEKQKSNLTAIQLTPPLAQWSGF